MTRARRTLIIAAIATVLVDATTKAWAAAFLDRPIEIGWSLSLQLGYNPGVAFGLGQSLPTGVLLVLNATICITIAWGGWSGHLRPPVAVGLLVGGAIGNLVDRLSGGSVVDMIHLTWWPTFNIADAAICVGAVLLAFAAFRTPKPVTATAASADPEQTETLP